MIDYNPDASIASWAYRYVGSLPGVRVVLAGMPKMEFLHDNIKTFENFTPLNEEEYKIVGKVIEIINANTAIPCTVCRYCESECPKNIAIPDYFALYNDKKRLENTSDNSVLTQAFYYGNYIEQGRGPASACINCHKCEKVCPQNLDIPKYLDACVVAELENYSAEANIAGQKK